MRILIPYAALSFLISTGINPHSHASEKRFLQVSLDQGLSQVSVYATIQDHRGFMWFATEDGLNRFDGYTMTVFYHDPADSSSISENTPISMLRDSEGNLWIGTYSVGLNLFDPLHESFIRFVHNPQDSSTISHDRIFALFEDSRDRLWVGTGNGLGLLDRTTKMFTTYFNNPNNANSLVHNSVRSIQEDRHGNLWIGTAGGVSVLDSSRSVFTRHKHDPHNPRSLSDDRIMRVYADRSGKMWIATWGGGLNFYDESTGNFTRYQHTDDPSTISDNVVLSVVEDRAGLLWVGTAKGLNILDRSTGRIEKYYADAGDPYALKDDNIRYLFEDQAGIMWIGTLRAGVHSYDAHRQKFMHVRHVDGDPSSLSNNIVWSFYEGVDSILYVGTIGGGLDRFDRGMMRLTNFRHDPSDNATISHNDIHALSGTPDGTVWVGTVAGLDRLLPSSRKFFHYRHDPKDPSSLGGGPVSSIVVDRSGGVWVGTRGGGLSYLSNTGNSFIRFVSDRNDPKTLSDDDVWFILQDNTGILWVATDGGGLNAFDPTTGTFTRYRNDPSAGSSLSSDAATTVLEDKDGMLWVGTDRGLDQFDRTTGMFQHFTVRDGLPNNFIYGMLQDESGHLWISTNKGLTRFDPDSKTFRNYDPRDGIQSNEFNLGSSYKSQRGQMFFGGVNGFNTFFPEDISDNPYRPPIAVTSFKIFNEPSGIDIAPSEMDRVALRYDQNVISFEFAALAFSTPEKNQYAYMLVGLDRQWNYVSGRRNADYTYINPGEYVFRCKASNSDGVWNEEGISIHLSISPPFWETWWFRFFVIVLLVGLGYTMYRYRINRLLEMHAMRLRIAADLHDEIGSNLSTIVVGSNIIQQRAELQDRDKGKLTEIAEIALQTSSSMREIVWLINPDHDRLDDLLLRMKDVAGSLLGEMSYSFKSPERLPDVPMTPIVRRNIFLIFKESLNNIVRHARATDVAIEASLHGGTVVLSISDNGVGFDFDKIKHGEGLHNLQKRASSIGAELEIKSVPMKGTTTILRVRTTHMRGGKRW